MGGFANGYGWSYYEVRQVLDSDLVECVFQWSGGRGVGKWELLERELGIREFSGLSEFCSWVGWVHE